MPKTHPYEKIVNNITLSDIEIGLNWATYGLEFISWGHASTVIAWAVATVLMGFCNGIWHGTPLAWEILIVKFVASAIGVSVRSAKKERIIPQFETKETMINIVFLLLAVGIVFNVVHLVFSGLEISACTSALCMHPATYWFLFVFLFILGLLVLFECVMIYYFWRYKRYVALAKLKYGKLLNPKIP